MATPGAVSPYHPFCVANPVAEWPGVGAQDAIHYLSGVILHRRFTVWDEGHAYELEIRAAEAVRRNQGVRHKLEALDVMVLPDFEALLVNVQRSHSTLCRRGQQAVKPR
ncbi:MAG: hypothetical protein OER90_01440 [Gemmatimonadota bacterium]|nr:hypothetical protein [Gemmatimonadota bacterium]